MVMMISNRKFQIKKAFWDNYGPDANYKFRLIPGSIFTLLDYTTSMEEMHDGLGKFPVIRVEKIRLSLNR